MSNDEMVKHMVGRVLEEQYPEYTSGIVMQYSSPTLINVTASGIAGYGISCSDFSNPILARINENSPT